MEKVKKMVEAGSSIPNAIRDALAERGLTISKFAEKYQLNRTATSNHINGNVKATSDTVEALIAELGGTADEWRELLWLAGKPEKASV
jgi:plasmid maintenance system antidote protein VapI